jgi:hypothetical protein
MKWIKKLRRRHWTQLCNAESESGEWDWFKPLHYDIMGGNVVTPSNPEEEIRLCRFDGCDKLAEWRMSRESWIDLVKLVKRIS